MAVWAGLWAGELGCGRLISSGGAKIELPGLTGCSGRQHGPLQGTLGLPRILLETFDCRLLSRQAWRPEALDSTREVDFGQPDRAHPWDWVLAQTVLKGIPKWLWGHVFFGGLGQHGQKPHIFKQILFFVGLGAPGF